MNDKDEAEFFAARPAALAYVAQWKAPPDLDDATCAFMAGARWRASKASEAPSPPEAA